MTMVRTHGNGGYAAGCRCEVCRKGHREYARLPHVRARENERRRRVRAENPEAERLRDKERYYTKRRTQMLAQRRTREYGLTPEAISSLLKGQDGRCALCRTDTPKGRGDWHVDHDHKTGEIRGLLCHKCNVGLGHFDDDPSRLLDAYAYLLRHVKAELADPS